MVRREEDGEDAHHKGMDDDYDHDDKGEDDNDGATTTTLATMIRAEAPKWSARLMTRTQWESMPQTSRPSPARSTWLILAQFDPPTPSARINYKTNLAPQYC